MPEAKARIKINQLLEESGWRFFDNIEGKANIVLENNIKITSTDIENSGDDFEKIKKGFIDYLLLDEKGFPFIVLEAKKEELNPLVGKEQARKYALSQNCRYVILSNGNQHYLWDLQIGSPNIIPKFPSPKEFKNYKSFKPNPNSLISETVKEDYIIITQKPDYKKDPSYNDESKRKSFLDENKLRLLRKYQIRAIERIQEEVKKGKDRFLFEMATGTGKTLTAAAVIKLFLRTGNAKRVLFLVDRLELEDQADKAFKEYLKNDYKSVIYKENRVDWRKAEIVVSTVQSFLFNNKYKRIFSPTDFDLVISDEAHRSIGGNSRAVFEYFIGYKLGLTATPKDYLKKIDSNKLSQKDPRELERRMLLDTYTTFGCDVIDGKPKPTFSYGLIDGVKDGFLVNPIVSDARTEITTQLLSDNGYIVSIKDDEGKEEEQVFSQRDFEKKFTSEKTNKTFCKTFLENALLDPVTGEIGKSIAFCVSQNHAAKITQILNKMAEKMYPGKYNSDFALQVTSSVSDSQQFTINFTNNKLNGIGNFNPLYKTSKTRVCVTVGMMTTGYDCPDLQNLCLMRPIFSPTDFVQIKGRGTRKHNFLKDLIDKDLRKDVINPDKKNYKLFDFFANCEYFEEKFNYDEIIKLPQISSGGKKGPGPVPLDEFASTIPDPLSRWKETQIGLQGMKIDRMYFDKFEENVKNNEEIKKLMKKKDLEAVEKYIAMNLFEKAEEYYNLEKLRAGAKLDRNLTLKEVIEKIFGIIPYFKSKDELLEDEFEKYDSRYLPDEKYFILAKNFFKSYITDSEFRNCIDNRKFALLNSNPNGYLFRQLPPELRAKIPEYIKENVAMKRFRLQ
ncbi:MAG TPA: DEAD/DEAH box helicase family protein [Ignavibacteria bacterium]|nr:DEAD/DEAH box helicase family protein [Ignavibacteria bacterium]HMR41553.1 DEAD/DEAH box helicase family protein [Ignavibacteria bacterium]